MAKHQQIKGNRGDLTCTHTFAFPLSIKLPVCSCPAHSWVIIAATGAAVKVMLVYVTFFILSQSLEVEIDQNSGVPARIGILNFTQSSRGETHQRELWLWIKQIEIVFQTQQNELQVRAQVEVPVDAYNFLLLVKLKLERSYIMVFVVIERSWQVRIIILTTERQENDKNGWGTP